MPLSSTLGALFERNARLYPRRSAVSYNGREYTHADIAARMHRLASALRSSLPNQARVSILSQNSIEYIETMGAAYLSGSILVTLNWRLAVDELSRILADCEPAVLLFEEQYIETVDRLRAARPGMRLICVGEAPEWAEAYEDVLTSESTGFPATAVSPDDTACLIYTSGTTGVPKGVMLSHRGLLAGALANCINTNAKTIDRVLITMPLFHVGATIMYLGYSVVGARTVLHRRFDAVQSLAAIRDEKITQIHTAPTMIHQLLSVDGSETYDTSSLTNIVYSSSPMLDDLLRRGVGRFGPIFTQIYGMTEYVGATCLQPYQHVLDSEGAGRLASAGQPSQDTFVRIVDAEGNDCETGDIGEIAVSGTSMMQGYWGAASAKSILRNGWLHTGDLGYIDDESFVFIVDRKKDMIVSGGENIYSREVESAILTHPDVAEVSVIGVPDQRWGEAVKAFVVRRSGAEVSADEIIAFCKSKIASYKKPRSVEFVDALPQLPSGKVDKKMLRQPFWEGQKRQI
ncbi:long-chain-fatty-acid--CoA ligase [Undibacter mobilis]|uniref:3-methylmercaptopropionyl-CoA ligase n=1 Tax=Undibacter mobilis TaxID=2292256 RepID=A0A371B3C2_9BRAD|nr:long-chain-fatty-acid--CoA ligase [Undibacter mobilis]RDV01997.1 AMP-dependent synthetase [Undibacter mobilis]